MKYFVLFIFLTVSSNLLATSVSALKPESAIVDGESRLFIQRECDKISPELVKTKTKGEAEFKVSGTSILIKHRKNTDTWDLKIDKMSFAILRKKKKQYSLIGSFFKKELNSKVTLFLDSADQFCEDGLDAKEYWKLSADMFHSKIRRRGYTYLRTSQSIHFIKNYKVNKENFNQCGITEKNHLGKYYRIEIDNLNNKCISVETIKD